VIASRRAVSRDRFRTATVREDIVSAEVEELRRIREFERAIQQRSSTKVEQFEFGTAYFNSEYPLSWAHNFLDVEAASEAASARELAGIADRMLGGAGLGHRAVWVRDDATGHRLNDEFAEIGWSTRDHLLTMVLRRGADRASDTSIVEELDFEAIRPALVEMMRGEPWAESEETVAMLVDRRRVTARATHLRHFAVRHEGRVVSTADLYSNGRTAQIEDVGTLEDHRGRGYARAVVSKAVEAAKSEGHDLIWLVADDDGWPKQLYAKLGFDPLARYWEFARPADDARREATRS
jgi:GNAT superfamily N-acetyltransferase